LQLKGYFHVSTQSHLQIAHFPPNTQFSPYYRAIFFSQVKALKIKKPYSIFFRKMSHLTVISLQESPVLEKLEPKH